MNDTPLRPVTRSEPCPVCTRGDWCSRSEDGGLTICMRHDRDDGTADSEFTYRRPTRNGGHAWARSGVRRGDKGDPATGEAAGADWLRMAAEHAADLDGPTRRGLAGQLGLPADALDRFPLVGRRGERYTTWPECDAAGTVVGLIRRDNLSGEKKAATGCRRGLCLPVGWAARPGPVYCVEGPTDTAAMTAAGLACVGRPSNAGGFELLAELLRAQAPGRPVVVVGENDAKPDGGHPGAACESLAGRLAAALGRPVAFAYPPAGAKDVRAWLTDPGRGADGWPERGGQLARHLAAGMVGCPAGAAPPGKGPAARRPVPEYRPFPVEALAPVLRDYVAQLAASIPADPAFAALPALVLAGAAAGAAVAVSPKRKFVEVPALWACVVGDSGTGKSPSARPTERLAFNIDTRMRLRYEAEVANYLRAVEELRARQGQDAPDGENAPAPAARPTRPVREHFALVDCTIERLAEVLSHSRRGVVMVRDELDGWFSSFTRYKGKGGGSDVPNWLSLYDAGPLRVHRRTGEPRDIEVDGSFVAVSGGIQPDILRAVLSDPAYVASGLAARVMFASPPKAVPRWSEAELSPEAERRFAEALDFLRDIPFVPASGPTVVRLSPDAKRRFVAMNNEFAEKAEGLDGGPMSAVLPKAVRFALRLALIDHLLRHADAKSDPTATTVSDASMESGETLARWLAHEAERVYAVCAEEPGDREARTLIDWVRRRHPGGVTARQVQRSLNRYNTAASAEAALNELVRTGLGAWSERRPGPQGGAPSRVFTPAEPPADGTQADTDGELENSEEGEVPSVPSASVMADRPGGGPDATPRRARRRYAPDDTPHEARNGTVGGGA